MRQYFNTREKAEINLRTRQRLAYKRIEKSGDKVIGDNSFIHCDYKQIRERTGSGSVKYPKVLKWYNTLIICTKQMMSDLDKINEKQIKFLNDGE
jgi:hypothetical protein